jgi:ferredoxin
MIPKIDVFRCDGCGACVKMCPPQIMGLIKERAAILTDLCEECGICHEACPIHAIHFRLPNENVKQRDPSYWVPRQATPNPGNWKTGVPLGRDGKGNFK